MNLYHNILVSGRQGKIKTTIFSESEVKTSFFAKRVNEVLSVEDSTPFVSRTGARYTYGNIVSALIACGNDEDRVYALYERIHGCSPLRLAPDTSGASHPIREEEEAYPYMDVLPRVTLEQNRYHHFADDDDYKNYIKECINRIPADMDGVRRSYGLEYEIYSMSTNDRSDLSYLLRHLPKCHPENDGSLGPGGVELVFDPMGEEDYINTVKTLKEFVERHHIVMRGGSTEAGMHTTYGVSNSECHNALNERENGVPFIQLRLNRISAMMHIAGKKDNIRNTFGRYFGHYRRSSLELGGVSEFIHVDTHENAMSIHGRDPVDGIFTCYEFRLPNWQADPEKVVKFFKATEWIFHREWKPSDMLSLEEFI